jgi:hypothetical protein
MAITEKGKTINSVKEEVSNYTLALVSSLSGATA